MRYTLRARVLIFVGIFFIANESYAAENSPPAARRPSPSASAPHNIVSDQTQAECPICMTAHNDPDHTEFIYCLASDCTHGAHEDCLAMWFTDSRRSCPTCRSDAAVSDDMYSRILVLRDQLPEVRSAKGRAYVDLLIGLAQEHDSSLTDLEAFKLSWVAFETLESICTAYVSITLVGDFNGVLNHGVFDFFLTRSSPLEQLGLDPLVVAALSALRVAVTVGMSSLGLVRLRSSKSLMIEAINYYAPTHRFDAACKSFIASQWTTVSQGYSFSQWCSVVSVSLNIWGHVLFGDLQ